MPIKRRSDLPSYPDGIVSFCNVAKLPSTFSAKQNPVTLDDIEIITCGVFAYENLREQDIEYAEQMGTTYSLKIRTPKIPGVDADMKAMIYGTLYDVSRVDPSKYELYIYLEGGREIAVGD